MRVLGTSYVSSFTNDDGIYMVVDENNAVFTICSRDDLKTGGHAACYLEWMEGNVAQMRFFDLVTPGHGRVQLRAEGVQVVDHGAVQLDDEVNYLAHYDTTKHHSYQISTDQARRVVDSFVRFMAKNTGGRYAYSLPGGKLGRVLGFLKGQRGVNCADLTLKLLSDAGITNVSDKLVNTPRYAAGSSGR